MLDAWVAPVALLGAVFASDAWVFLDSRRRWSQGRPVIVTIGPYTMAAPEQWLVGCIVLWVVTVPLYIVARRA